MDIVRKLFFAPFFLFSIVVTLIFADQVLADPLAMIFGFSASSAWTLLYLISALLLTGLFYILFVSLSNDWRLVVPVGIMAALVPVGLFTNLLIAGYTAAGIFVGALICFFVQQQKMKTYITFSAVHLLQPQIKLFNLFLILSLSIGFYFTADTFIKEKGFSIPDPLIEAAVSMSGQQQQLSEMGQAEESEAEIPQLSPQLISQLKQNPELLRQYGVTVSQLDALAAAGQKKAENGEQSGSLVTELVKNQVNTLIEPYKEWIAPFLTLLFFVSLTSLSSFVSLLLPPLIGLIFLILEKSNFIHFEKEMREVKKLMV